MSKVEIEVLAQACNHAVLHLPGRAFPGAVLQGDSLAILWRLARSVRDRARQGQAADLLDEAEELCELLEARLRHYQAVLQAAGIPLPYGEPVAHEPRQD